MSHSVSPLGSLSSPSPSPPPNPIDESELSELTDDDHDANDDNDDNDDDNDRTPLPKSVRVAAPRNAEIYNKRKKRGGLVPAPMWGWAYKNGPSASTSTPTRGSPPANPTRMISISRPLYSWSGPPLPFSKQKSHSTTPDAEEEEEEELPAPPRAMEEEEGEDPDPRKDNPATRKASRKSKRPSRARRKKVVVPEPFDSSKIPRSKRGVKLLARKSKYANDLAIRSLWENGYKLYDANAPTSDEENGHGHAPLDGHGSSPSASSNSDDGDDDEMDVDDDDATSLPHSPARPTLNINPRISPPPSTSAIDPTADVSSLPPSLRASADPTVSPPDEGLATRPIPDQDHDPSFPDDDDHLPPPDRDIEPDGDDDEDVQPEEPSQPPSPTPVIEPEPEPEQEDEDPDLQPAHRAEALDVLATIELKFALLREKVYVEKMEGLAWEEALVWDGTHPELHHLQSELTKRRDKRLMLASKKRTYEIEAMTKKKREEGWWCWEGWDTARTELQIEMVAETNRKRRKLERERRTIERPPGARRLPTPILNPPPAPTLRQIANTFPLPSHISQFAANKKLFYGKGLTVYPGLDNSSGATAYPDLAVLSPHEIAADLEFLFQHRRLGYGFGIGFGPPMGVPIPGFGPAAIGFGGPAPVPGFAVNGLGIGPGEAYPSNPGSGLTPGNNPTQFGGPPLVLGSSGPGLGPPAPPVLSSASSQNTPNAMNGSGPGVVNADGPSFSQPSMGVFQTPSSIGTGPTAYPVASGGNGTSIVIGPGGTTSTPSIGLGGTRIQRPSGFVEREREFQRERERELIHRERELTPRDRELAVQRERDFREREREIGPNVGPGYPAWNSKPAGGMDWAGDARRQERERMERNERDRERDRSQVQPIVSTATHRHLHQHTHPHSHTHQTQHPTQPPHQPHPVHAHQSHSHPHAQLLQHHPHGQHSHQHTHQHGTSHAPPHHHVGQHHHHRHHHHVVHHHHSSVPGSSTSSSGPDGASPLPQGSGSAPGVQTMEIINLSASTSSKSHWKRDEAKFGGSSMPGSRPSSTHPLPPSYSYEERERDRERERERERERDRPIATPFVLAPSHHTMSSAASPPRHGWTPGPGEPGPAAANVPSAPYHSERFHTPVPHRFSNSAPNGLSQLPRPLTTSPPRTSVSTASPSISVPNVPPSSSTSTGPFPLTRKPSPVLPKLGMPPLGYSPRLAGPGVVPPTGPGVPGVLSTTSSGPGVTPSGILTSGPGVPPGPGIAPAPSVVGPGENGGPSMFTAGRTASPLISYTAASPVMSVATQKVGVDGP